MPLDRSEPVLGDYQCYVPLLVAPQLLVTKSKALALEGTELVSFLEKLAAAESWKPPLHRRCPYTGQGHQLVRPLGTLLEREMGFLRKPFEKNKKENLLIWEKGWKDGSLV